MHRWLERRIQALYEQLLQNDLDRVPTHVAVIQDGNRRYARERGEDATNGHREGAKTTEQMLEWCEELGIEELTLYAFSTENFERPPEERAALFDLIERKLREFADSERVHDSAVGIRVIGDVDRLPDRVKRAVEYAELQTDDYDEFVLNVALAYGGRSELLSATRRVLDRVDNGKLEPASIELETIENELYDKDVREVDLIIRTGGDERTSNFLPWYANGNEAAVYFCAPYWPEFSKAEFLRGIRTYQYREQSWQRTRAKRMKALLRTVSSTEAGGIDSDPAYVPGRRSAGVDIEGGDDAGSA